jgi:hypothetical protein
MMLWKSAVMKKDEVGSWKQQRICGWFREVAVNGGCWGWGWGRWSQALFRLYAFWELKVQESVNDSYYVWSSFLYIPYSYLYIQQIGCRVGN